MYCNNSFESYQIEEHMPTFWSADSGDVFYRGTILENPFEGYHVYPVDDSRPVTLKYEIIQEGVLGISVPSQRTASIDYRLRGEYRAKVFEHEMEHIESPYASEMEVRERTDTLDPTNFLNASLDFSFGEKNERH